MITFLVSFSFLTIKCSKIYSWSKYVKISFCCPNALSVRWQKRLFGFCLKGLACAVGAKANVPFEGRHKIELKKMCGGENKKYRRVGNECRLTRCPFAIWSVCWSPVKMVYFFIRLCQSFVCCVVSSNTLAGNFLYKHLK
jgi:hypothetical protein